MHIQARVVFIYNTIGHVLQAISDAEMPGKIKIKSNVGGKVNRASQIFISKLVLTDDRRIDTDGNIYFLLKACKTDSIDLTVASV
jgi:hypothetical protein